MGYSLKIERPENPITLEQWSEVVGSTEGIRLAGSASNTLTNPLTGEVISLKSKEGDAEVFDSETGQWHSAIMWRDRNGTASFNSRIVAGATDYNDLTDSIWLCLASVAKKLSAQISGEEGELFDLDTAKQTSG
ncbi:hypothetical protein [Roseibacillus persicicus]|uniref:DUF4376 domain-containing protein n=1 Tax=Roseibacillus persicicus TaxID=454148 RepID=A0A918U0Y5_9BACT|nr:hypothetical protein [Roseibacillus persicicus]GHC69138.1 hypothetical protein GCM10007100_40650 [Roseibacillus persicicus]